MNDIQQHGGDPVQEAIDRSQWKEYIAFAEAGGANVLVVGDVMQEDEVFLDVYAGGEFDPHPRSYSGGVLHTTKFDRIWYLKQAIESLSEKWDLEPLEGGHAD